jgi:hypothetical protein
MPCVCTGPHAQDVARAALYQCRSHLLVADASYTVEAVQQQAGAGSHSPAQRCMAIVPTVELPNLAHGIVSTSQSDNNPSHPHRVWSVQAVGRTGVEACLTLPGTAAHAAMAVGRSSRCTCGQAGRIPPRAGYRLKRERWLSRFIARYSTCSRVKGAHFAVVRLSASGERVVRAHATLVPSVPFQMLGTTCKATFKLAMLCMVTAWMYRQGILLPETPQCLARSALELNCMLICAVLIMLLFSDLL